jgi:hypothetical protein
MTIYIRYVSSLTNAIARQPMYLIFCFFTSLFIIILVATGVTTVRVSSTNIIEPVSRASLENDGNIMINGKPFFPIGLYHNSQASPDWSSNGVKRLNDLKKIAEAGFNTIHAEIGGNEESDVSFLKEAVKLGVYVLPNFSYDNRIKIISKYKENPAIIGWDIADDVDHPNNKFTTNNILGWHREVKQIDSSRLTYISGAFLNRIERFIHSADLVGFQSYPIDNDPEDKNPLRNNYYTYYTLFTEKLGDDSNQSEEVLDKRTIIANLQSFPWKNKPPTFHEVRNMTYAALINGIKGIIYYTYFSDGWELSQNIELWEGMKILTHEIKYLSTVFLEGQLTKIDTKIDNLYAGKWIYKDSIYLVVLSTLPKGELEASIDISLEDEWSLKPFFSGQPYGMKLENGNLKGFIKSGDVHVYQLLK